MMPASEINVGDWFSDPIGRGFGSFSGLEWCVVDKKEGLIKVQAHRYKDGEPFRSPIWKKPSDRMFCESCKL